MECIDCVNACINLVDALHRGAGYLQSGL